MKEERAEGLRPAPPVGNSFRIQRSGAMHSDKPTQINSNLLEFHQLFMKDDAFTLLIDCLLSNQLCCSRTQPPKWPTGQINDFFLRLFRKWEEKNTQQTYGQGKLGTFFLQKTSIHNDGLSLWVRKELVLLWAVLGQNTKKGFMKRNQLRVKLVSGGKPRSSQLCKKRLLCVLSGQARKHWEARCRRWGAVRSVSAFSGLELECDHMKTQVCPIMSPCFFVENVGERPCPQETLLVGDTAP